MQYSSPIPPPPPPSLSKFHFYTTLLLDFSIYPSSIVELQLNPWILLCGLEKSKVSPPKN
jgi:hypothetical protein